jgi:DNA-binding transcriptional LysR family regulator
MAAGMALDRRFLPSMTLLRAFEASARLQSFTAAATELSLTQSAVSRQIIALEEMLGTELFTRERQRVKLTRAGETYFSEIRVALARVATATFGLRANPRGGVLNLAILPTFGTRWLAPRLPGFLQEHPGITINLSTRLSRFDFQFDSVDAAIHFGQHDWPGAELELLMSEVVIPACNSRVRKEHRFRKPADLLRAPLLHLDSRPDAWGSWFRAYGVAAEQVPGMLFDQFAVAAQAAIAGLGVALLPRFLIETELERGDLVEAIRGPMESAERYYLAWPSGRSAYPPLQAFREWILAEARR